MEYSFSEDQEKAVEFLLSKKRALLCLGTGFGKTLISLYSALACWQRGEVDHVVCVVPVSAVSIFKKELSGKLCVPFSVYSGKEERVDSDAVVSIFTYSVLAERGKVSGDGSDSSGKYQKEFDMICSYNGKVLIILDEVHTIKNVKSKIFKFLYLRRGVFDRVWGMTATPILNHLEDVYGIMSFIAPGIFDSFWDFRHRYLVLKRRKYGNREFEEVVGYKNQDQLKMLLAPYIYIRKLSFNFTFDFQDVELSAELREFYSQVGSGVHELSHELFAPRLHLLQRIVDNSVEGHCSTDLSVKERRMLDIVGKICASGESVLIYADYISTLKRLREVLEGSSINYTRISSITGEVSIQERQVIERDFGEREIVLLSNAGSQSINFGKANHVLFYSVPFSIGVFLQVAGRIARYDSVYEDLYLHVLRTRGTIDEYKGVLLEQNRDVIQLFFGKYDALPEGELQKREKQFRQELRKKLLWGQGRGSRKRKDLVDAEVAF